MLGSGINPESFKQDYSGFARAAEIQAQGLSNLGGSIAGAIKDYGQAKQEHKKVDAYNKASAKAIEAAITLGNSYGITGAEQTLRPFLSAYNDPNLSPIEKAAMLDEGKAMIPNVFGRFDKSQAMAIENARNAPPLPAPLVFKNRLLGGIHVKEGSDGEIYDPKTMYPIFDLPAFGRGEPPEVFSNQSGLGTASQIDAGLNVGSPPIGFGTSADGGPGVLPLKPDTNTELANSITKANGMMEIPSDVPEGLSPLTSGNVASQVQKAINIDGPPVQTAQAQPNHPLTPRYISDKSEAKKEPVTITMEKLSELISVGVRPSGSLNPDGTFNVTDFNTTSLPQGMQIESDGKGGFKMTQGAGVGTKEEKQKMAKENATDKAVALTSDLNYLSDKAKSMAPGTISALGRMVAEKIPVTDQAEIKQIIDRVKATLTLENLQAMRNSNPTGAALGTVSDKDTKLVEDSATSLSNAQSPEVFQKELIRLKNLQHDIIYGSERMLKNKLEKGEIKQADFDNAIANAPAEYIDENGVIKSRKIQPIIPSSDSESIYKKHGVK